MTKNDNKKLKEIIDLACEEAKRLGNTKVSPEHLFLGMLRMDQARAIDVLIALGVDFYEVKAKIEQKLNKQRDKSEEMPDELDLTLAANSIVKRVIEEAWKLGDEEVESEHLMLSLIHIYTLVEFGLPLHDILSQSLTGGCAASPRCV